ncbi:MAG: hypothetical protein U0R50_14650 [Gaiellales bacterium]
MTDAVTAVAAVMLSLGGSSLIALRLASGSTGTLVLGTYVIWIGQITSLSLALSSIDALGQTGYLIGAALVCSVLVACQLRWPAAPVLLTQTVARWLREVRSSRLLTALGLLVAAELVYSTAIVILTAPADDDSLQYHLGRQAYWLQHESIALVPQVFDFRWNAFPPNADFVYAFLLSVADGERLVESVNLVAAVVLVLAVAVGASRLGLPRREAIFGALLAGSLPIVALQAPSTLTDLQVASLVCCGAALLLRRRPGDLGLGSFALAVVIGAKVTGIFAIPVLGGIAWMTWRPRWRPAMLAIGAAVLVGGYWYLGNALRVGDLAGETPAHERGSHDPIVLAAQTMRLGLDVLDLPGTVGRDILVYPIVGVVILVTGIAGMTWRRRRREWSVDILVAGLFVASIPTLALVGELGQRFYRKLWWQAGRPSLVTLDLDRVETVASSMQSGAGPIGVLLVVIGSFVTFREFRRGRICGAALGFALAPLLWLAMVGVAVAYFRWSLRYALPGFALAAMTWGIVLRIRSLAAGLVGATAVTLLLSYTHFYEKPAGIRLLEPRDQRSAFTTPRPETMAWSPEVVALLRYLEYDLPQDATVAVFPLFFPRRAGMPPLTAPELLEYPVFGPSLDRTVHFALDPATATRTGADWYLAPSYRVRGCVAGWRGVAERSKWTVFRRAPERACPG